MLTQQQTTIYKKAQDMPQKWFLIDCTNKVLGRLAVEVGKILLDKNNFHYTPHMPNNNHIILINAQKIAMTGNKLSDNIRKHKVELRHTGYIGGLKSTPTRDILNSNNAPKIIKWFNGVIQNMLPRRKNRNAMLKRLHVYIDETHKHTNHKITTIEL